MMKIKSAKAKGRRLAVWVMELLYKYAQDLMQGDIVVTPASVPGDDLMMSPAARAIYPFAIECKNQETLNIWEALAQVEARAGTRIPVVFFKRNKSKVYVTLEAEKFIFLMR